MQFLCTDFTPDGDYSTKIEATNWADAETKADLLGYRLDGIYLDAVPCELLDDPAEYVRFKKERGALQ